MHIERVAQSGENTTWRLSWALVALVVAAAAMILSGCIQYPNCETDEHCQEDNPNNRVEYCLNGMCQQCRQDSHCQRGNRCVAGACESIPGWCETDTECTGRQKCWDNQCGPECRADGDCNDGEVCKNGTCQLAAECVVDADCPAGKACVNQVCVDKVDDTARACDNLEAIYFDFDESALRAEARDTLRNHAECVKDRNQSLQIQGHTDERGTEAYNLALGERRARAAMQYIISLGAARNRLSTISYGESQPSQFGSGESVWQQNRRAEFQWR